jgi:hypothetical protein
MRRSCYTRLAMALAEVQLLKVNAHLTGKLRACPMCGNDKWGALEIIEPMVQTRFVPGSANATFAALTGRHPEAVPLLLITCTNCFHVVPYAWRLIEAKGA